MMDNTQARIFAIVYRRHLLTLIDKIERDFGLGKYENEAQPEPKAPDVIDISLDAIDTGTEKP